MAAPHLPTLSGLACRAALAEGPAIIYNVPGRTGELGFAVRSEVDASVCSSVLPATTRCAHPNQSAGLITLNPSCVSTFSPTGQDIPDDLILSLAGHDNFLGVKECTGGLAPECSWLPGCNW